MLRWIMLFLLLPGLVGCGFHLRGAVPLPEVMQRTLIKGIDNSPLYYDLESALLAAGSKVVKSPEAATATLVIQREHNGRRVLSVDSLGGASEYELSLLVVFSLVGHDGRIIASNESLRLLRDYNFDPNNVLGSGSQESLLQDEMRRDAAQQILRRLQSLARAYTPTSPEKSPAAAPAPAQ